MTRNSYTCAAIAIGWIVAAREAISKAQENVELNFGDGYTKDLNKIWGIINNIVADLNEELDCEIITEEEEDE